VRAAVQRIVALMIKEFHSIWRDRKTRFVLIVPPILQLFVFAFAATLDVKNVTLGILNRDNGEQSIELLARFQGSPTFTHLTYLPSNEAIESFINNEHGIGVLSINEQFSRDLDAGNPVNLMLILDGRKTNTSQIVAGYVSRIVNQFNVDFAARAGVELERTRLMPRNWFNPNLLYYWYTVPGLVGILTMLEALILTSLSIARERELGTFDQLLVSPAESIEIMISKALPAAIISVLEGTAMVFCAVLILRIPFTGSLFILYLGMFFFVLCIVGIGLFISSLCQTQQQAILGSQLFMTPSVILSGFATPIQNMPTWLQPFTYLVPLRYFFTISKGVFLKALPLSVALANVWPLALIAIGSLTGATLFFRRRLK
jgi:drug efflux transport system permease protein